MSNNNQPWPLKEASALLENLSSGDSEVLFQTGFGPSGLPHIGTFAEVARTTFIRRAFASLSNRPTRLIAFSDDMDGLRKVPLNVPNREAIEPHLGKPLSSIPDPFGTDPSFSAHMNRRLCEFLDSFDFDYSFRSSTDCYRSGQFNEGMQLLLERVDGVLDIILPTLRPASREGWSPFMVVCPSCGRNLSTSVTGYHADRGTVSFCCDGARSGELPGCGAQGESSVLDGHAKVGWKVDWALRWFTFGVDYEMYGKDLIESAQVSGRIVRLLGGRKPSGLFYEMFLDEEGRKISKSIGKGISVDRWQSYAPVESLLAFLYQNPRKAKRLHYDVIPQFTDQYLKQLSDWHWAEPGTTLSPEQQHANLWNPSALYFDSLQQRPRWQAAINYSLVRNLVVCMGKDDPELVEGYLLRYDQRAADQDHREVVAELVRGAIAYDRDWVAEGRTKEAPPPEQAAAFRDLAQALSACQDHQPDAIQSLAFDIARGHQIEPKLLFRSIYRGLIGQDRGPRFGSFMLALGLEQAAETLRELASRAKS
ncbi:MAG: lysine--tRNA ligase [Rickettsiales bacterium]|nr:lysine--tRNA ligase [Rickettsiales bacterium]